jgi:hypothetical protein
VAPIITRRKLIQVNLTYYVYRFAITVSSLNAKNRPSAGSNIFSIARIERPMPSGNKDQDLKPPDKG